MLEQAGELLAANRHATHCTWIDQNGPHALETWAKLDADIRFILVGSRLEDAVAAHLFLSESQAAPKPLDEVISRWEAVHRSMLQFACRHAERCLFIWDTALTTLDADLLDALSTHLAIDVQLPGKHMSEIEAEPVATALALKLVAPYRLACELADELDGTVLQAGTGLQATMTSANLADAYHRLVERAWTAGRDHEVDRQAVLEGRYREAEAEHRAYQALLEANIEESKQDYAVLDEQNRLLLEELDNLHRQRNADLQASAGKECLIQELQAQLEQLRKEAMQLSASKYEAQLLAESQIADLHAEIELMQAQIDLLPLFRERISALESKANEREQYWKDFERAQQDELSSLQALQQEVEQLRAERLSASVDQESLATARVEHEQTTAALLQSQVELEAALALNATLSARLQRLENQASSAQRLDGDSIEYTLVRAQCVDSPCPAWHWCFSNVYWRGQAWPHLEMHSFLLDGFSFCLPVQDEFDGELAACRQRHRELTTSEHLQAQAVAHILQHALPTSTALVADLGIDAQAFLEGLARVAMEEDGGIAALRFDGVDLYRDYAIGSYEHIGLRIKRPSIGTRSWDSWDVRLACAAIAETSFGTHLKLEFPIGASSSVLESWFPESKDEFGAKLELRFAQPDALDIEVWSRLSLNDRQLILALVEALPRLLAVVFERNKLQHRSRSEWKNLADEMRRILRFRLGLPNVATELVEQEMRPKRVPKARRTVKETVV
ncbi:hypothetical protein [Massilia sp. TS11]|uniref:hypothetical protein n=1 Tax=Massilia sp. TS11 TaxID=2908003 RepID=UPI001EDBCACB|nr:hypothetical protein [Massilia sp. TS11]MCG2582823.1 hypothetical protein [Massilia sp. TS11]